LILRLDTKNYAEIIKLWEASVCATHDFLQPEEISFYKPLILKYALPENQLFGIFANQKLAGFIGIRPPKIEMLFIHPDFFGKKLGSKLLNFAVNELKCTLVDVNEENPRAYKFYRKHGFKLQSRNKFDDNGKPHPVLHLHLVK